MHILSLLGMEVVGQKWPQLQGPDGPIDSQEVMEHNHPHGVYEEPDLVMHPEKVGSMVMQDKAIKIKLNAFYEGCPWLRQVRILFCLRELAATFKKGGMRGKGKESRDFSRHIVPRMRRVGLWLEKNPWFFERAMLFDTADYFRDTENAVRAIADYAGLEPTEGQMQAALDCIDTKYADKRADIKWNDPSMEKGEMVDIFYHHFVKKNMRGVLNSLRDLR